MNMLDWAKKEVEIACKKERGDIPKDEFDYGCACYESALKAFESLCNDEHSGYSIHVTQQILNRLIDGRPLTSIEDTDDIWNFLHKDEETKTICYQCNRMSSLFKDVFADGRIEYSDTNRFICIDIDNPNLTYHSGLVHNIMSELYPITMPYLPEKTIKVYCRDLLTDPKNGDFDTVGIFYALKEENGEQKRIEINRFFREPVDDKEDTVFGWVEIDSDNWFIRMQMARNRLNEKEF